MKIKDNQSLFDLAIQTGGSVEAIFDAAIKNDQSITDALTPGQDITDAEITNASIQTYYRIKALTPATGDVEIEEGIEFWHIEYDFTVT